MERVFKRYFNSYMLFNFLQNIIFMYICGIKTNKITKVLPWWLRCWRIHLQFRRPWFDLWDREIPWRRKWQPTVLFLPGKSHGQRNLAGYSPWGCKESDITEWLSTNTHNHKSKKWLSIFICSPDLSEPELSDYIPNCCCIPLPGYPPESLH